MWRLWEDCWLKHFSVSDEVDKEILMSDCECLLLDAVFSVGL